MEIFKHLSLRSCMNCGTAFKNSSLICQECLDVLVELFDASASQNVKGLKVRSLLNWNPKQSDLLSHLIISLKTDQIGTWQDLAKKFLLRRGPDLNLTDNQDTQILISVASELGKNHAQMWGQSLSQYTGIPHWMGLVKISDKVKTSLQRLRTKPQRSSLQLKCIVDLSMVQHKKVVLVDDVVTTGSTLHAAYLALGQPAEFECWSLCYRNPVLIAKKAAK